jgi:hypothetical protein
VGRGRDVQRGEGRGRDRRGIERGRGLGVVAHAWPPASPRLARGGRGVPRRRAALTRRTRARGLWWVHVGD